MEIYLVLDYREEATHNGDSLESVVAAYQDKRLAEAKADSLNNFPDTTDEEGINHYFSVEAIRLR